MNNDMDNADNIDGMDNADNIDDLESDSGFSQKVDAVTGIHLFLDLVGFVPVYGAVADLINMVVYACEADWRNAGLSLLAAIPGLGDLAAIGKLPKLFNVFNKFSDFKVLRPLKMLFRRGKGKTGARGTGNNSPHNTPLRQEREIINQAENTFTGKLKGRNVTLNNVRMENLKYIKRSTSELDVLRRKFDSSVRSNFLKNLGQDVNALKKAGFSETDILKIKNGNVPTGWQVHHKYPLDDSGTNSFDNLVLIKNHPYHKVLTNHQNKVTSGMKPGDEKMVEWPVPDGPIYPAQ